MKKLRLLTAAGFLALSGVAIAHQEGASRSSMHGWGNHCSACPQPEPTTKKITEDQARDLVQPYASKHFPDFKDKRSPYFGEGYETMCYQTYSAGLHDILYSLEYFIEAKNRPARCAIFASISSEM